MPRFSDRTLARVRANVNDMLTETCRIERQSQARGSMGEPLHNAREVVATNVSCRIIRAGERNRTATRSVASQEAIFERYRLITPVGTGWTVDDRVVMSDGRVFEVVDVDDGLTDEAFAGCIVVRVRT